MPGPHPVRHQQVRNNGPMTGETWIPVVSSAVTALAALGGVAVTQRATRSRDFELRLWEKRAATYLELATFLTRIEALVAPPTYGTTGWPEPLNQETASDLLPAEELASQVRLYGTQAVTDTFRTLWQTIHSAAKTPPRPPRSPDVPKYYGDQEFHTTIEGNLRRDAAKLHTLIRSELAGHATRTRSSLRRLGRNNQLP